MGGGTRDKICEFDSCSRENLRIRQSREEGKVQNDKRESLRETRQSSSSLFQLRPFSVGEEEEEEEEEEGGV